MTSSAVTHLSYSLGTTVLEVLKQVPGAYEAFDAGRIHEAAGIIARHAKKLENTEEPEKVQEGERLMTIAVNIRLTGAFNLASR